MIASTSSAVLCSVSSAAVFLIAKNEDHPVQPSHFGPDHGPGSVVYVSDYVEHITWTAWGDRQATGIGEVRLLTDRTSTSPVAVTLGGLKHCGGQAVYTTYSLTLGVGAQEPKYWPSGQTGTFPCQVTAGGSVSGAVSSEPFNENDPSTRHSEARGACVLFSGLGIDERWKPKLPIGSSYSGLCRMRWTGWATSSVTGKGVMRNGTTQWGTQAVLSGLAWCPGQAMSYTALAMTLYGDGERITGHGNVSNRDTVRLRRDIGRPGVKKRTYRQAKRGCYPTGL